MSGLRRVSLAPVSDGALNRRTSVGGGSSRASIGFSSKGGRDSIGVSSNRRSSVGGSRKSISTETRNIQDPEFKNAAMKTLLQYLTSHDYDHPIAPRSIQKPSVKDFTNIVLFLFRQVDKTAPFKGKFEDDVVYRFKQLKYMHNISKQNLAAPGTPHTWPTLLATLHWLVDLLIYCDNSTIEINPVQEYLFQSYEYFNKGEDDQCAELYEDFVSKVRIENENILKDISDVERETRDLQIDLDDCERALAQYPLLQDKLSDYKSDYSKFQQLISELTNHQLQLENKGKKLMREEEELDECIDTVTKEVEMLQQRVAAQSISAKEAELMKSQQIQLQKEQDEIALKYKNIQEKIYTSEDLLRNGVSQLEKDNQAYNHIIESLSNISGNVRKPLLINVDTKAKKKSGLLLTDIHNHILPSIYTLRNDTENKLNQFNTQILDLDDHLEQFLFKIEEAREEESNYTYKIQSFEEVYNKEKSLFEQISNERSNEIRNMENQLNDVKDLSCDELIISTCNRKIVELKSLREQEHIRHNLVKKEMINDILNAVTDCAHFRDYIQTQLREVKTLYEDRLDLLGAQQQDIDINMNEMEK